MKCIRWRVGRLLLLDIYPILHYYKQISGGFKMTMEDTDEAPQ